MIVDEGDIVTCGRATTFLNLMIYLIEKYFGHDLAVHASKIFLIDMERPSQLPFKIQSFSITHGESSIARIQAFIAEHNLGRGTIQSENADFHVQSKELPSIDWGTETPR